ncbi:MULTISPECIES: hypothetical protein [Chryseobacterium]|uniref:MetA-pathway of phenol degradation n=1 Tax=Chryseobacterium taihuense TaxID=1141221 RepID=A0A4U8WFC5_9FLAO|nr:MULTISPECIES: hypothetical protein [Chryseobacterium]QQV01620.1 hypothetical protein I6I61_10995 [Chryseobacterium sp. FDAARGOS 1104]VFB05181.1 Uncharacterised protein [Chryseobacterium taihuense]
MKSAIISTIFVIITGQLSAQNGFAFNTSKNPTPSNELNHFVDLKKVNEDDYDVRPFITDDARVVGDKLAQLETWVRFDKEAGQHWILGAYGPNKKLELTAGGVYGYQVEANSKKTFSYALPLLQAKMLFKEYAPNKGPGFGMVLGTFLPLGKGSFKPAGYGTFGFLTVSQCIGEDENFLFHGNVGGNYLHSDNSKNLITTWGFGTQVKAYKGMHIVGEIFSGDPYIPGTGTSWQAGYRYFFNDLVQIDMTVGNGISGDVIMPFWYSAGVRIVTEKFLKNKKKTNTNTTIAQIN